MQLSDFTDLKSWGLDRVSVELDCDAGLRIGRVIRVDRGECDVITGSGLLRVVSDSRRQHHELAPVTGDWVEIASLDNGPSVGRTGGIDPVIARVLPRHTSLRRRDPARRDIEQVLAANVEFVGVVHGLDRPLLPGRLERLLVVALDSGAKPVVLLTKCDIAVVADIAKSIRSLVRDHLMVVTSAVDGTGLDQLRSLIEPGLTMALIGASGVGKSTLVNALASSKVLKTGEVRSSDAKGRHTTDVRRLILLSPPGGLLLDMPGIRAVGPWNAEYALRLVFADLVEAASDCRFRDCSHDTEPGCAIVEAVAMGMLDGRRVEHFKELGTEFAAQREREAVRVRRDPNRRAGRGLGGSC